MESEIRKVFQISGYLLRSFANGLDGIARHIESLSTPPSDPSEQEPASETQSGVEPEPADRTADAPSETPTEKPDAQGAKKIDIILGVIAGAEDGVGVDAIARKTGFDKGTIRSAASRLRKQGKVKSKERGVYMAG